MEVLKYALQNKKVVGIRWKDEWKEGREGGIKKGIKVGVDGGWKDGAWMEGWI